METILFKPKDVKRFFNALSKQNRFSNKNRPNQQCDQTVFVRRTLNKWFSSKFYKLIREDCLGVLNYQYIYISNISFRLGWGTEIIVYYINASKSFKDKKDYGIGLGDILNSMKISICLFDYRLVDFINSIRVWIVYSIYSRRVRVKFILSYLYHTNCSFSSSVSSRKGATQLLIFSLKLEGMFSQLTQ